MKRCIYIIPALFALVFSCSEDESPQTKEKRFVAGDVLVGIRAEVSIDQVFDLMNEKGVTIDMMSGFFTYSLLPNDSLDYINNQLATKSYLNQRGWNSQVGSIVEDRIRLTTFFFEMDLPAQTDWLETMEKSQLKDLEAETKSVLVKVTPGTEFEWIEFFKSHPYVTWTELNEYADIVTLN
jgi:hypothetical protein